MKKITISVVFFVIFAVLIVGIVVGYGFWKGIKPIVTTPELPNLGTTNTDTNDKAPEGAQKNLTGYPLNVPDGFQLKVFSDAFKKPRQLELDPRGRLLVTDIESGTVSVLADDDNNGEADRRIDLISGLRNPHGLYSFCTRDGCILYIAETGNVSEYRYSIEENRLDKVKTILELPSDGGHYTRSIIPLDNKLLVSVGSKCNVCNESDERRSTIMYYNFEDETSGVFATGLRNAVFMARHPKTNEIWATEMGRDWLGDDLPPDELNIISEGGNYGWPFCYGNNVADKTFSRTADCSGMLPAKVNLPAHSAPLGLAFFNNEWPDEYQNALLVSLHGSWNRSVPTGYKVVRLSPDNSGGYGTITDFLTGFLTEEGSSFGRPVDILIDGKKIYISDDKAGVIYLLTYLN